MQLVAGESGQRQDHDAPPICDRRRADRWSRRPTLRIGTGYDLHRLVPGRALVLGGVRVPFELGLDGHSDADIVCHAVTDAVLGAAALGDIGRLFPDTDADLEGRRQPRRCCADAVAVRA